MPGSLRKRGNKLLLSDNKLAADANCCCHEWAHCSDCLFNLPYLTLSVSGFTGPYSCTNGSGIDISITRNNLNGGYTLSESDGSGTYQWNAIPGVPGGDICAPGGIELATYMKSCGEEFVATYTIQVNLFCNDLSDYFDWAVYSSVGYYCNCNSSVVVSCFPCEGTPGGIAYEGSSFPVTWWDFCTGTSVFDSYYLTNANCGDDLITLRITPPGF